MMKKFRVPLEREQRSQSLSRAQRCGSDDDIYTGKRVTKVPEAFTVTVGPRNFSNEIIGLDVEDAKKSVQHLKIEKPRLSKKALTRLSKKNRSKVESEESRETPPPLALTLEGSENSKSLLAPEPKTAERKSPPPPSYTIPLITTPDEGEHEGEESDGHILPISPDSITRISTVSTDSGLGEDPSQNDRESATLGVVTENSSSQVQRRGHPLATASPNTHVMLRVPKQSFRAGTKQQRKSMLLSELCVVTVSLPSEIAQGQKGKGAVLKFRFSPYTQIEFLRIAILKVGSKLACCCFILTHCVKYM